MAHCKSCEASVVWATNERSGKASPFDATPDLAGKFVIVNGKARYATPGDDCLQREKYTSHFATCPAADQHRSTGGRR